MSEEDDIVLTELSDADLVLQMHDDLYDGLKEEIEEGTQILLDRGWSPERVLGEALVDGMTVVGVDFECKRTFDHRTRRKRKGRCQRQTRQ